MKKQSISRRGFLKGTAIASAAIACPTIVPSSVFEAEAPSKRIMVGHIGVGGQGGGLLRGFVGQGDGQSVAVCDAFKSRRDNRAKWVDAGYSKKMGKTYKGCKTYGDFREMLASKDIDAVVVATPDHWHVPITIMAAKAGKDVYCEKPLGISVEHNKAARAAIHRYKVIFQYGTQQRSFNTHCARACELVRAGYIGDLKSIDVVAPNGRAGGNPAPQPVPADLDYEMWLGPAPKTPYCRDRIGGRWFIYDYAIGFIAGWGAHPLDIAHWGYPHTPVEYEGTGVIPTKGLYDTVINWDVKGKYESGVTFTLKPGGDRTTFTGTKGSIWASRGRAGSSIKGILKTKIKPNEEKLLQDTHHYRNFLKACKSRKTPAADIDSAVQSDFMSHLGDIAIRTKSKIKWDPKKEVIIGNDAASRMLSRALRAPWKL
ncbi:MAG: Gfo/Idh/MocA family oxidoreductase [Phycisphaerae bacterium]|jgi:predicted dehydrogenase|nr:Gfo/Idh/MocA family oxidoreductase [Phycisphaerae bacterium]